MGRELGRISGPLLADNLKRNGSNLAFESKLLYLNVVNGYIGVNSTAPSNALFINGKANTTNLIVDTDAIIANLEFNVNQIQNVSGSITFRPLQSATPTVTAPNFQAGNIKFSSNSISNTVTNADIILDTAGTGTVVFNSSRVNVDGTLHATGNITWDGSIVFGNNNSDNVTFSADVNSHIIPDITNNVDLGTTGAEWHNLYAHNLYSSTLTTSTLTVNNINVALTQGHTIYVSVNGSDTNVGISLHNTYLTIKKALSVAVAGDEIVIFPGTYTEIFPLTVPQGVSVRGMDIRNVIVKPTSETNTNNAFLMNGETTVSFLTVRDFYAPGNAFSFASNFTVTTRSPYVQNTTVITSSTTLPGSPVGSALFPTSSYLAVGTGITLGKTCTVEGWFRTTLNPASSKIVLVAGNGNRGISIYNGQYGQNSFSATKFTVDWEYAGNIEFTVPTMVANTWYHLAVTQTAAGVMTLWLNGVRSSTGTLTPNWTFQSQNYRIGGWQSQGIYSQGVYITNVRMTTTAVYDVTQTIITVPTSPLTAVAGTQLLLLEDTSANLLKDSSANNYTITNSGTVAWSALSPLPSSSTILSAGNGALVDGSVANGASKEAAMLFDAVTLIVPDAIGIQATNGARVEWINGFTYFANKGIYLTEGTLGFASLGVKFGAEMRSIGSANVYGTYGAYADGAHTLGYLIGHNFGYVGSGLDSQNDYGLVIQANEIVAINGGKLYYDSTDQEGDYRIGDIFLVEQSTGNISFNAQAINYNSTGSIVLEGAAGRTFIHAPAIEVGNIRIHDNNIDSMIGPVNILAFSGSTYLNTNVTVTGNTSVTGDTNIKGTLTTFGNESTDTVTLYDQLTQTIKPNLNNTYTLGKTTGTTKIWNTLYAGLFNVDNVIQVSNNTLTTLTTNTDLQLGAAGTGIVSGVKSVEITNNLTVSGASNLQAVGIVGTLDLPGSYAYTQTGDVDRTGNTNITGAITNLSGTAKFGNNVQFTSNTVQTTVTNSDLQLVPDGTGRVYIPSNNVQIDNNLTVGLVTNTGVVTVTPPGVATATTFNLADAYFTSNYFNTTTTNRNLELRANGTGKVQVPLKNVEIINDLTVNGTTSLKNTVIGTTLPSTSVGSAQFSGSNYLSVAGGAGTAMGTGNFTWECWVYPTASTSYQAFIDSRTNPLGGGDTTGFYFGTNINTLTPMYYTNGLQLASSINITLNAWNHVALTRASGNVTIWVNGASGGTRTGNTTNLSQQRVFIGSSGLDLYLKGKLTNVRIVKGLAVYTGTFTPPTSALAVTQSAGTNISAIIAGQTQLLLLEDTSANLLKDSSTNNFTVTNNGTVTWSALSPVIGGPGGTIPATLTQTGNYTQTGAANRIGNTSLIGLTNHLTVSGLGEFGSTIQLNSNTLQTIATNTNLVFSANGTGKVIVPTNNVVISNNLIDNGAATTQAVSVTNIAQSTTFKVADAYFTSNYFNTTTTNRNLELRANGTGIIKVLNNNVELGNGLTVNGATSLKTTDITGTETIVGNVTQIAPSPANLVISMSGTQVFQNASNKLGGSFGVTYPFVTAINSAQVPIGSQIFVKWLLHPITVYMGTVTGYVNFNTAQAEVVVSNPLNFTLPTYDANANTNYAAQTVTVNNGLAYRIGNTNITGNLTASSFAQFQDIRVDSNVVTTTVTNNDLNLQANGTGRVVVPTNNVEITNNLRVLGNTYLKGTIVVGTATAGTFTTGDAYYTSNYFNTTLTNSNLELRANGSGRVQVPLKDVEITNNLTVSTGTTGLKNTIIGSVGNAKTLTLTGNKTQTGAYNQTGNTNISGLLTVTVSGLFPQVSIIDNVISGTASNTDVQLKAAGTGKISIPSDDVRFNQTLTVVGTTDTVDINSSGTITANKFKTSDITIENNSITIGQTLHIHNITVSGDFDFVKFTTGPAPITKLYLTKYVSLDNIAWFGIQVGSAWTAAYDVTQMLLQSHFGPTTPGYGVGDNILDATSTVLSANTTYTMRIQQTGSNQTEYIFSTISSYTASTPPSDYSSDPANPTTLTIGGSNGNTNLLLSANGVGKVSLEKIYVQDTTISTQASNFNITITPSATKNLIINSNTALKLPVGTTGNRTMTAQGELRFNSTDSVFSGFSTARRTFGGVYSADRLTYARAHPTNNTINFVANGTTTMSVSSDRVILNGLLVDNNFSINGSTLAATPINSDLTVSPSSGITIANGIPIQDSSITNTTTSVLTLGATGTGYVKFAGTGGIVIPVGLSAERPATPEVGAFRYNPDNAYAEVYDGNPADGEDGWIPLQGVAATLDATETEDITNLWALIVG